MYVLYMSYDKFMRVMTRVIELFRSAESYACGMKFNLDYKETELVTKS